MESLVCDFVSVIVRGVNWLLIGGIALFIFIKMFTCNFCLLKVVVGVNGKFC